MRGPSDRLEQQGIDGQGLGILLENGQVRKVIASYVGENRLFAWQYLEGRSRWSSRRRARSPSGSGPAARVSRPLIHPQARIPPPPRAHPLPSSGWDLRAGTRDHRRRGASHTLSADAEGNFLYRHTARHFNPLVDEVRRAQPGLD